MARIDATALSDWREGAACRGSAPAVFYPETEAGIAAAKAICRGCGVRGICLEMALRNRERHGVWGGLSERERARIRGRNLRVA